MFVKVISTFNNREIASIAWLLVFIIFILLKKEIRASIYDILKMFLQLKIFVPIISSIFYTAFIVSLLAKVELWNYLLIKDTVYWFLISAFVMLINANKANQEANYFRKLLRENLTFFILLEFIINLNPFSLMVEIFLVPIVTITALVGIVAATNKETASVEKLINYFLAAIVFYLIITVVGDTVEEPSAFVTMYNLRTFILPPILTIGFIPFIYFLALWMNYEAIYLRIDLFLSKENKSLAKEAKRRTFRLCYFKLRKLNKFSQYLTRKISEVRNRNDLIDLFDLFKKEYIQ